MSSSKNLKEEQKSGMAKCSNCGRHTGKFDIDNADNYCSFCGAKMNGENNEN